MNPVLPMIFLNGLLGILFAIASASARGEEDAMAEPSGLLPFDARVSLHSVVQTTFENYPQTAMVDAMRQETSALQQRSDSWIPGYPMVYVQNNQNVAGDGEGMTQWGYQFPIWRWGQRDASRAVTDRAAESTEQFGRGLRHEVAGLVRESLWNLKMTQNRHEFARTVYEVSLRLVETVNRRVELGDLAQADLLLAQSDSLEKKTALTQASVDLQHAHQAFANLSRMQAAPEKFDEDLSKLTAISEEHPQLAALNAMIERAQADVEFVRQWKQGTQPTVLVGAQHRAFNDKNVQNDTNVVLQVPIGGDAYNEPFVAQANLALTQKITERDNLIRLLQRALKQAQQTLDADRKALDIARSRREMAETLIRMNRIALETGEIQLIDFLKVQTTAQAAIWDAMQKEIQLKRDIAAYNQVVGVTP
ncbi:TolC family protein [Methylococcus mesophilus]|uniref:TolC family protein n=1 Tax=Methylococcus mesophilus TaxID=2993564 RepID=UPI00224B3136|nr:TolC family protein [Methylococcus mesophilus]UZR27976.1 TolC family protein [Methylococcus mesophilus]